LPSRYSPTKGARRNREAVEEVEEAEEGLDGEVVDGSADAHEDHADAQELDGLSHAGNASHRRGGGGSVVGTSGTDRRRGRGRLRPTTVSGRGDFGIVPRPNR
jgi:hypothetical protein